MQLTQTNKGRYIGLTIRGETRQETIDWRNYFYNYGIMKIGAKRDVSPTLALDDQEKQIEELPRFGFTQDTDGKQTISVTGHQYLLTIFVSRDRLIEHYAKNKFLTLPGGRKYRKMIYSKAFAEAKEKAKKFVASIPTDRTFGQQD